MTTIKENKQIKELLKGKGWKHIADILRSRRDELAAKILYNTGLDEKVFTETDGYKLEIRILNKLLNLPKIEISVEREMTEEELLDMDKEGDLEIGSVDDLFKTAE